MLMMRAPGQFRNICSRLAADLLAQQFPLTHQVFVMETVIVSAVEPFPLHIATQVCHGLSRRR